MNGNFNSASTVHNVYVCMYVCTYVCMYVCIQLVLALVFQMIYFIDCFHMSKW